MSNSKRNWEFRVTLKKRIWGIYDRKDSSHKRGLQNLEQGNINSKKREWGFQNRKDINSNKGLENLKQE